MSRAALVLAGSFAAVTLVGCGGSGGDTAGTPETTATTSAKPPNEPPLPAPQTKPKATTITIRVVDGRRPGGIARPKVEQDEQVVLVIRSDVADEVHLHGYDILKPVRAGGTARLRFVAEIPGRFELELEERGIPIAELTVR